MILLNRRAQRLISSRNSDWLYSNFPFFFPFSRADEMFASSPDSRITVGVENSPGCRHENADDDGSTVKRRHYYWSAGGITLRLSFISRRSLAFAASRALLPTSVRRVARRNSCGMTKVCLLSSLASVQDYSPLRDRFYPCSPSLFLSLSFFLYLSLFLCLYFYFSRSFSPVLAQPWPSRYCCHCHLE